MTIIATDFRSSSYINRTMKCGFCGSTNMDRKVATCKDCGTTNPNYNSIDRRVRKKKEL